MHRMHVLSIHLSIYLSIYLSILYIYYIYIYIYTYVYLYMYICREREREREKEELSKEKILLYECLGNFVQYALVFVLSLITFIVSAYGAVSSGLSFHENNWRSIYENLVDGECTSVNSTACRCPNDAVQPVASEYFI